MIIVSKKDSQESSESLIRRFSRRVLQSGIIKEVKAKRYFKPELSRNMRRTEALERKAYLARTDRPVRKSRKF